MSSVYPRVVVEKVIVPLDPDVLAQRIIDAREADPKASKAQIVGGVLQGSDDVAGFGRVWDEVEAERVAMAAVNPADYDTAVEYVARLDIIAEYLDPVEYVDGVLNKAGALTWNELRDKLSPVEA